MSKGYDDFLNRYLLYRTGLNMSQEEFGKLLGKSQSHLSKLELRKNIVSFEVLEELRQMGCDIDELVTGRKQVKIENSLTDYLEDRAGAEWKRLKEVLVWVIRAEFEKNGGFPDEDSKFEYEVMKQLLYAGTEKTVMLAMRNALGINQDEMAERLGVDVKKCRGMEKGRLFPDAELLVRIYEICALRPAVFFCRENSAAYLLDHLWNILNEESRKEAGTLLEDAIRIYKA